MAIHRLVDRVVEYFPHEVMEACAADAPYVHAGALADGLQPFENRDVFRGVVRRCHVYTLRFETLMMPRALLWCITIVAAFPLHASAATEPITRVPVTAAVAALAERLGMDMS